MALQRRLSLIAGVIGYLIIVILSVVPAVDRPHTGAGGGSEHFAANVLVAAALSFGLAANRLRIAALIFLCASAGILEIVQRYIPGRNSELWGFFTSSMGAALGVLIGAIMFRLIASE
ncbi:VanZ family protein [Aestuariivirga sp.]|uniref:VanZ family protein n=1 Tax=Aestuariivirga sp. TaxID=2650926 RepID=UPI0039E70AC3